MQKLQNISEKIKQRRSQMLVHSYLYYHLDTSIVSDHKWQEWADELTYLQQKYPEKVNWYDKAFKGWDGSTGMHLPVDTWIQRKAEFLLQRHGK